MTTGVARPSLRSAPLRSVLTRPAMLIRSDFCLMNNCFPVTCSYCDLLVPTRMIFPLVKYIHYSPKKKTRGESKDETRRDGNPTIQHPQNPGRRCVCVQFGTSALGIGEHSIFSRQATPIAFFAMMDSAHPADPSNPFADEGGFLNAAPDSDDRLGGSQAQPTSFHHKPTEHN